MKLGWALWRSDDPLMQVLRPFGRELKVVAVFSVVANVLMLTPTFYMLQVYDHALVSQSEWTLLVVSLVAMFLFAIMAFSEWARSVLLVRMGVRMDRALQSPVFEACFEQQWRSPSGSPSQGLHDLTTVRQFITGNGVFAFFDAPWLPLYLLVLFLLHPWLGVAAVVFAGVQVWMAWWGHGHSQAAQLRSQKQQLAVQSFLQSKLRNMEALAPMGMVATLWRRWQGHHWRAVLQAGDARHTTEVLMALSKFVRYAQATASLAIGAWLVVDGQLSAGAMIAGNVLMTRTLAPLEQVVAMWPQVLGFKEAFARLRGLLQVQPPHAGCAWPAQVDGVLHVHDLSLSWPGQSKPVLELQKLTIKPGRITVVMGPSGSGKSTLGRVLLGMLEPQSGEVLLDGEPVSGFGRDAMGPQVGYLPQDVELFEGSMALNIARMGEVDGPKVIQAAQAAGLHDLILKFPQGYDSPVGAGGSMLSGGQRQRVGLARALFGEPQLLVLDEPNAHLDDEGERALMRTLLALRDAGRTVVLISHRSGVLSVADDLVVLDKGRLVVSGPRDGVLKAVGAAQAQQSSGAAVAAEV